jgi:hypothetical protein
MNQQTKKTFTRERPAGFLQLRPKAPWWGRWSVFRLYSVDGLITKLGGGSSDDDDACTFTWIPGKQYWSQNECDPGLDLRTGEGKQIHFTVPLHMEDTMEIHGGWGIAEIEVHFKKICHVPERQRVMIRQLGESECDWGLEAEDGKARWRKSTTKLFWDRRRMNWTHPFRFRQPLR